MRWWDRAHLWRGWSFRRRWAWRTRPLWLRSLLLSGDSAKGVVPPPIPVIESLYRHLLLFVDNIRQRVILVRWFCEGINVFINWLTVNFGWNRIDADFAIDFLLDDLFQNILLYLRHIYIYQAIDRTMVRRLDLHSTIMNAVARI